MRRELYVITENVLNKVVKENHENYGHPRIWKNRLMFREIFFEWHHKNSTDS